jgi:hypothetical protein
MNRTCRPLVLRLSAMLGLVVAAALLAGCDKTEARTKAMNTLLKACKTPARISVQFGGWDEHVRLECEVAPAKFAAAK